jgi:hypothetical protein
MDKLVEGIEELAKIMVMSGCLGLIGMMRGSIKAMKKSATKSWQRNLTDLILYFLAFLAFAGGIIIFNLR